MTANNILVQTGRVGPREMVNLLQNRARHVVEPVPAPVGVKIAVFAIDVFVCVWAERLVEAS